MIECHSQSNRDYEFSRSIKVVNHCCCEQTFGGMYPKSDPIKIQCQGWYGKVNYSKISSRPLMVKDWTRCVHTHTHTHTHWNEYHGFEFVAVSLSTHPFKYLCVSVGNNGIPRLLTMPIKAVYLVWIPEGKVLLDSQGNLARGRVR